jgi:hypothetical protein
MQRRPLIHVLLHIFAWFFHLIRCVSSCKISTSKIWKYIICMKFSIWSPIQHYSMCKQLQDQHFQNMKIYYLWNSRYGLQYNIKVNAICVRKITNRLMSWNRDKLTLLPSLPRKYQVIVGKYIWLWRMTMSLNQDKHRYNCFWNIISL